MKISIIAAVAENGAIGRNNKLLYRLPDDMKHFKQLTTGHTVLMGRKTFESLPKGALPDRRNLVLSRSHTAFAGCETFATLRQAIDSCQPDEHVFIIGGASVYKEALPIATDLIITHVKDKPADADTFFPQLKGWKETSRQHHPADSRHSVAFDIVTYRR